MRLGYPPTHVQSHFAEQRLGHHHVYAVNASEVHTCDTLPLAAQIKAWSILGGWLLCLELLRRRLDREGTCEAGEALLQSLVALSDSVLIGVVHIYFLMQHEQQYRTPGALQAFGDFFGAGVTPRIAEHSQLQWIALAGHDRPYDRLSGQPAYGADHVCQLHVHLCQGLFASAGCKSPLPARVLLVAASKFVAP